MRRIGFPCGELLEGFPPTPGPTPGTGSFAFIFDYGLDDVRANLEFRKQFEEAEDASPAEQQDGKSKKMKAYVIQDYKTVRLANAISHIEENDLQRWLREETIALWQEIEAHFAVSRKPKLRHYEGD